MRESSGSLPSLWLCMGGDATSRPTRMSFISVIGRQLIAISPSLVPLSARAISAGVAASEQAVGSSALGGNWQLDVRLGGATGVLPFSVGSLTAFRETLGAWTPAASLATARGYQTATLLGSGKVLVAGGYSNGTATSSAELYDPVSNTWFTAGSMAYPQTSCLSTASSFSAGQRFGKATDGTSSVSSPCASSRDC
jgi:hypothetical protein